MGYKRNDNFFDRADFRVQGDIIDIYPAYYEDEVVRLEFFGDELDAMYHYNVLENKKGQDLKRFILYPTSQFSVGEARLKQAIKDIKTELNERLAYFEHENKLVEYQRLKQRVEFDLEMLTSTGMCKGVENYARHLTGLKEGDTPYTLFDYFAIKNRKFLVIVDESHVTIPQIRAMYGGDAARKKNLVEYGFRLPAAMDNRPLTFEEFESLTPQAIYVSATPAEYELIKSEGIVVDQVIRPTGLLDPIIEVRPALNQVDDLMEEISQRAAVDERVLVTTLTKRMAEELTAYLSRMGIRCNYIHSDIDTLERIQIMDDLRKGLYDVLIGVNLLREGLDLPEVSLVAILDADKEGFLRSHRSLTQTAGRAARNVNGKVIFYADKITESMKLTIDETNRRRAKQLAYNEKHGITPKQVIKNSVSLVAEKQQSAPEQNAYVEPIANVLADPVIQYMTKEQLAKSIERTKKLMMDAAKKLEFIEAAQYRDELVRLQNLLDEKK